MDKWIKDIERSGYFQLDGTLEKISFIQKYFAMNYTFENIDVLINNDRLIDEYFLIEKLFKNNRGGLCYELNGALYLLLKELGFKVELGSATVWSNDDWLNRRTHTIIFYFENNELYIIDSGFGNNLTMQPLHLDGKVVTSSAGHFRLRTKDTEKGEMVTEKLTKSGWAYCYAFYPEIVNFDDLNRIKEIIHNNPDSPFNKTLLIAKVLKNGVVSINEERFNRKWINRHGLSEKEERIEFKDEKEKLLYIQKYCSPSIFNAAKHYIQKKN